MTSTLRLLVCGLSMTTAVPAALAQDAAPPLAISAPAGALGGQAEAGSPTVRNFGVAGDRLFLSGERSDVDLSFFVTASETAQTARLVLSYTSAVSVMPETSRLQVFVNDIPVGGEPIAGGPERTLSITLPTGIVQPGYNSVRIVADQHHRVDCSLEGTYELWTRLDPAASGIDFGMRTVGQMADLSDLPALFRSATGRAAINLVMPEDTDLSVKGDALMVVQAIARLARIANIDTTISSSTTKGDGLDVVFAPGADLPAQTAILGGEVLDGVAFAPADVSDRARLTFSGGATGTIEKSIEHFVAAVESAQPAGTPSGLVAMQGTHSLEADQPVRLGDIGLDAREFSGRLYRSDIRFDLPADFYAADYDAAHVTLDAAFAGGLDPNATLIGSANGRQVFTLPLSSPFAGQIRRQDLRVPLSALRPGRNELTFTAIVPKPSDAVCDPTTIGQLEPRILLSDTSTITLPDLARVGHVPEIASFTGGGTDDEELSLFVPGTETVAFAKASDLLAKIAASTGRIRPVKLVSALPDKMTGNLLALGTYESLPPKLLEKTGIAVPSHAGSPMSQSGALTDGATASPDLAARTDTGETGIGDTPFLQRIAADTRYASFADAFSRSPDYMARVEELAGEVAQSLPAPIRGILGMAAEPSIFVVGSQPGESRLVVAQAATADAGPTTWTVVAASDQEHLSGAVDGLTDAETWDKLGGAISVVSANGDVTVQPAAVERLYETQARTFSNARLVFAGWLSRHLDIYVAVLLALALSLGLVTAYFLRQVGAGRR